MGISQNDLSGKKFGLLTLVRRNGEGLWHTACDCGNVKLLRAQSVTSGNTRSCGCARKARTNQALATGAKPCTICEKVKPLDQYQRRQHSSDGRSARCLDCMKRTYYRSMYGIGYEQKAQMVESQNGKCANDKCGADITVKTGQLDHCHKSGAVRGVLCRPCNVALGFLNDDIRRMKGLVDYLAEKTP